MVIRNSSRVVVATIVALLCVLPVSATAPAGTDTSTQNAAPDAGLVTDYGLGFYGGNISVCGYLKNSDGCYGFGSLGRFGHAGAFIEGDPVVDAATNTVKRRIYTVDQSANGGTRVVLNISEMTETVSDDTAVIDVQPVNSMILPLVGGPSAKTYLAGNSGYLYIGTNQDTNTVRFNKQGFGIHKIAGAVPATPVSAITTNQYGFVSVTYGGVTGTDGYAVFDPAGNTVGSGSGALFMLGTQQSLRTASLLKHTPGTADLRVHYDAKITAGTQAGSAPDGGLYDAYAFNGAYTSLTWNVCGSVSGSSGCYASGKIGGFGRIGTLIEGKAIVRDASTVARHVYVIDQAAGGGTSTTVRLHDYLLTESIHAPNVTAQLTPFRTTDLTLTGGAAAQTYTAANTSFLFASTDQSIFTLGIAKTNAATQKYDSGSPPEYGSAIWASAYGYVDLDTQAGISTSYTTVGNDGNLLFDGGGKDIALGTQQGYLTSSAVAGMPVTGDAPPISVHLHPRTR